MKSGNKDRTGKKVLEKNYMPLKKISTTFDMQFNTTDIFIVSPIYEDACRINWLWMLFWKNVWVLEIIHRNVKILISKHGKRKNF